MAIEGVSTATYRNMRICLDHFLTDTFFNPIPMKLCALTVTFTEGAFLIKYNLSKQEKLDISAEEFLFLRGKKFNFKYQYYLQVTMTLNFPALNRNS